MIVQYHVGCISFLWQDLQDLFYWVVYNLSVLHGLCCLSETLVARVLKVKVIPIALFCRDAWMIKFHLYIALLCSQCAENVNPL